MGSKQHELIPPFRYAIVEEGFYRGAYPSLKNFRFLRRLRLRTVVSLTPEPQPNRDMRAFCAGEGVAGRHFYVDKYQQDGVTLTAAKVVQILQIAIRPENLPLYLHCLDGTNVTGLVVTCFRKLQSWSLSASTAEFCKFQRDGEISREESNFLEAFRGEIDIPPTIPPWLWQGVRTVRHPTFKLRLLPNPPRETQSPPDHQTVSSLNRKTSNSVSALSTSKLKLIETDSPSVIGNSNLNLSTGGRPKIIGGLKASLSLPREFSENVNYHLREESRFEEGENVEEMGTVERAIFVNNLEENGEFSGLGKEGLELKGGSDRSSVVYRSPKSSPPPGVAREGERSASEGERASYRREAEGERSASEGRKGGVWREAVGEISDSGETGGEESQGNREGVSEGGGFSEASPSEERVREASERKTGREDVLHSVQYVVPRRRLEALPLEGLKMMEVASPPFTDRPPRPPPPNQIF